MSKKALRQNDVFVLNLSAHAEVVFVVKNCVMLAKMSTTSCLHECKPLEKLSTCSDHLKPARHNSQQHSVFLWLIAWERELSLRQIADCFGVLFQDIEKDARRYFWGKLGQKFALKEIGGSCWKTLWVCCGLGCTRDKSPTGFFFGRVCTAFCYF